MELWVRSQDKNNLKKANDIYVEHITKDYDSWIGNIHSQPYVITSDNGNLGFYGTKERALEILDDIQDKLINCTFAEKRNGLNETIDFMPNSIYVYQMPSE